MSEHFHDRKDLRLREGRALSHTALGGPGWVGESTRKSGSQGSPSVYRQPSGTVYKETRARALGGLRVLCVHCATNALLLHNPKSHGQRAKERTQGHPCPVASALRLRAALSAGGRATWQTGVCGSSLQRHFPGLTLPGSTLRSTVAQPGISGSLLALGPVRGEGQVRV